MMKPDYPAMLAVVLALFSMACGIIVYVVLRFERIITELKIMNSRLQSLVEKLHRDCR